MHHLITLIKSSRNLMQRCLFVSLMHLKTARILNYTQFNYPSLLQCEQSKTNQVQILPTSALAEKGFTVAPADAIPLTALIPFYCFRIKLTFSEK